MGSGTMAVLFNPVRANAEAGVPGAKSDAGVTPVATDRAPPPAGEANVEAAFEPALPGINGMEDAGEAGSSAACAAAVLPPGSTARRLNV